MNITDKVRMIAAAAGMSLASVARACDMSPQCLSAKMKRGALTDADCSAIANACGAEHVHGFRLKDGTFI